MIYPMTSENAHANHNEPTLMQNDHALCTRPQEKGTPAHLQLRPWQEQALRQALFWLLKTRMDNRFLINAAPGSGKTRVSCAIAQWLFKLGEITRVIVIAPRSEVVRQWASDFAQVTGRHMSKVTGSDGDICDLNLDVCATWAAMQGLTDAFQALCDKEKVLVICDEHHHAAVEAMWGRGAESAFSNACFTLLLTGTPMRSDGEDVAWLPYDDAGAIDYPTEGTYTLTYGEAIDLGYCRPATFHRHEGRFSVTINQETLHISGQGNSTLPKNLSRVDGLQTVLNFYRLACIPKYEADERTPARDGYHATMMEWAIQKLDALRLEMPDAGGLIIAPTIKMAEYFAKLIENMEGEAPVLVHSRTQNPENKIKAFKKTQKRWLVSVSMISEGVDIPRMRVLVYLPKALTELAFRQAIGRVVRNHGPQDMTRAYIIIPSFETLEWYARRVEEEIPASFRAAKAPKVRYCPICGLECALDAKECLGCGHIFPVFIRGLRICPECQTPNARNAECCKTCGTQLHPLKTEFSLTLDEALRVGVIVRCMDISEDEVRDAERIAKRIKEDILKSGDASLIRLIVALPEESYARLQRITAG